MIGNRKTRRAHRTLCNGGRLDFKISTEEPVSTVLVRSDSRFDNLLIAKISRTRTIKPIIPPPLPNFQAFPWPVATTVSSATAKESRQNCKRRLSVFWNMFTILVLILMSRWVLVGLKCRIGWKRTREEEGMSRRGGSKIQSWPLHKTRWRCGLDRNSQRPLTVPRKSLLSSKRVSRHNMVLALGTDCLFTITFLLRAT